VNKLQDEFKAHSKKMQEDYEAKFELMQNKIFNMSIFSDDMVGQNEDLDNLLYVKEDELNKQEELNLNLKKENDALLGEIEDLKIKHNDAICKVLFKKNQNALDKILTNKCDFSYETLNYLIIPWT